MEINLQDGIYISNAGISIIVIVVWLYLLIRNFNFAYSFILIASYIIEYSKVNLLLWSGSLLLPFVILFFIILSTKLRRLKPYLTGISKIIFSTYIVYFILSSFNSFFYYKAFYDYLLNILDVFARNLIPFLGIIVVGKNQEAVYRHLKYNAWISNVIGIGFLLSWISNLQVVTTIQDLRYVKFMNMGIGGFSFLFLWSFFYYFSKASLTKEKKSKNIFLLVMPIILFIISQTRGLLLSIGGGIITILYLRNDKIKALSMLVVGITCLVLVSSIMKINIGETTTSLFNIFADRFQDKQINSSLITDDSRFLLWAEAYDSIIKNPFGGATISSELGVHNMYLQIIMNTGIFGIVYLLIMISSVVFILFSMLRSIKTIMNKYFNVICGTYIGIIAHAFIGGLLGGVDIFLYWSFGMSVVMWSIIAKERLLVA